MQIGSIVKSFDFPHTTSCYMIGRVTDISDDMITCETIKIVHQDQEKPVLDHLVFFRTPVQGAGMFDAKFERVVVLG